MISRIINNQPKPEGEADNLSRDIDDMIKQQNTTSTIPIFTTRQENDLNMILVALCMIGWLEDANKSL